MTHLDAVAIVVSVMLVHGVYLILRHERMTRQDVRRMVHAFMLCATAALGMMAYVYFDKTIAPTVETPASATYTGKACENSVCARRHMTKDEIQLYELQKQLELTAICDRHPSEDWPCFNGEGQ